MIRNGRNSPTYGRGTHTLGDEAPLVTASSLIEWLDSALANQAAEFPRPPSVALEVLEQSRKPSVSMEQIAALLCRDPLLAGKVLRIANSPIYRGAMAACTLRDALVRIGMSSARDVVMEAAFHMTVIRAEGFDATLEMVRQQSMAIAWVSRLIARRTPMEAESAFLIGLLHHIGISVGLVGVCSLMKAQRLPLRLTAPAWRAVQDTHESLGQKVVTGWKMHPSLALAIAHHHNVMVDGHPHPSIAIVRLAEWLVEKLGWRLEPFVHCDDAEIPPALELVGQEEVDRLLGHLRLTREQLEAISKEAEGLLAQLATEFGRPGRAEAPEPKQAPPRREARVHPG